MRQIETVHCPSCGSETNVEPGQNAPCPECWADIVTETRIINGKQVLVVLAGDTRGISHYKEENGEVKLQPGDE